MLIIVLIFSYYTIFGNLSKISMKRTGLIQSRENYGNGSITNQEEFQEQTWDISP